MGFIYDWCEERLEIQSIHRWSSGVMVLILILHIARVYLTGGFKKPRELIWITGIILALTTVSFGVTGYSLPITLGHCWLLGMLRHVKLLHLYQKH